MCWLLLVTLPFKTRRNCKNNNLFRLNRPRITNEKKIISSTLLYPITCSSLFSSLFQFDMWVEYLLLPLPNTVFVCHQSRKQYRTHVYRVVNLIRYKYLSQIIFRLKIACQTSLPNTYTHSVALIYGIYIQVRTRTVISLYRCPRLSFAQDFNAEHFFSSMPIKTQKTTGKILCETYIKYNLFLLLEIFRPKNWWYLIRWVYVKILCKDCEHESTQKKIK